MGHLPDTAAARHIGLTCLVLASLVCASAHGQSIELPGHRSLSNWSTCRASLVRGLVADVSLFHANDPPAAYWSAKLIVDEWIYGEGPESVWILGYSVGWRSSPANHAVLVQSLLSEPVPFLGEGSYGFFLLIQDAAQVRTVTRHELQEPAIAARLAGAWIVSDEPDGTMIIPTGYELGEWQDVDLSSQESRRAASLAVRMTSSKVVDSFDETAIADSLAAKGFEKGWLED